MKCDDVIVYFTDTNKGSYPSEVLSHLEKCENCRSIWEQQRFAVQILAVKRHEHRTALECERAADAICKSISPEKDSRLEMFSVRDQGRLMRLIIPMAATLALIATIGIFNIKDEPVQENRMAETRLPVTDFDLTTILGSQPEWMGIHTNTSPEQIQYGPLRSRIVEYELD